MNTFSYLSAHKYHEYEYDWSAQGILFNVCRDAKNSDVGDLHCAIFPHTVLIFQHTVLIQGRKGLFTLISVIYADLLGILMLIFCISARLLCQFFEAEITPVLIPNVFHVSECVLGCPTLHLFLN